jgi:hypothetical protein
MLKNQTLIIVSLSFLALHCHAMEGDLEAANSGKSVSFIYYPSAYKGIGHAEVEVNGDSWCLIGGGPSRNLNEMINKSTSDGMPFFRFVFKADSGQIQKVAEIIPSMNNVTFCSRAALAPLGRARICSVPLPFNASPLLAASYLAIGKKLGLNNVNSIQYYGNPSCIESASKMMPGVLLEGLAVVLVSSLMSDAWSNIYDILSNN